MRHALRDRLFAELALRPLVMGIVNVTPDSFSDGGLHHSLDDALAGAQRLATEGADLLDLGGESTRPGGAPVSAQEEQARVLPALAALSRALPAMPLSIDTYRASTAEQAVAAGAVMINDVWGLQKDPAMAETVARTQAGLAIMHNRETTDETIDILADIKTFFTRSLALADAAGVPRARILLDPGLGFGKTADQNEEVLARLPELACFGLPLLAGASRKRFIGRLTGQENASERGAGSVGAHLFAVHQGARMIRVHDVALHVQALTVFHGLQRRQAKAQFHV